MAVHYSRPTEVKRAAILTRAQFRHVLKVASITREPERNQLIICLSHALGLRVTEMARITVADLLHSSGRVRNELRLRPETTKNNRGRVLPIASKVLLEHLERYLALRIERGLGVVPGATEYRSLSPDLPLILSSRGTGFSLITKRRTLETGEQAEYLACDPLEQTFRILYKKSGIKGGSSHSGRRSYATNLAAAGVDLEDVSRLLGHESLEDCRAYVVPSRSAIRQAFEVAL